MIGLEILFRDGPRGTDPQDQLKTMIFCQDHIAHQKVFDANISTGCQYPGSRRKACGLVGRIKRSRTLAREIADGISGGINPSDLCALVQRAYRKAVAEIEQDRAVFQNP